MCQINTWCKTVIRYMETLFQFAPYILKCSVNGKDNYYILHFVRIASCRNQVQLLPTDRAVAPPRESIGIIFLAVASEVCDSDMSVIINGVE